MRYLMNTLGKVVYILDSKQKAMAVLVLVMSIVGAVFEILGVSAIVPLVNVILNPIIIQEHQLVQNIPFLEKMTHEELVIGICICVVALYIVKNIYFVVLAWVRVKFTCKIKRELSVRMMKVYMGRGYEFFLNKNYGELSRGIDGDTISLQNFLHSILKLGTEILSVLLIFLFMCYSDWQLAMGMMLLCGFCLIIINQFFRKSMYQVGIKYRRYEGVTNQALLQALQGIKEVLIMQKQQHFVRKYEESQIKMQLQMLKQTLGGESPAYIVEGVCVSGLMVIVCIRVITVENPLTLMATLSTFVVGAFRVLPSLGKIASLLNTLTNSIASVDAYYEKVKEAEKYKVQAEVVDQSVEKGEVESNHGTIEIEHITFGYENTEDAVLEDATLTIKMGQAIGIVGESGSGKSTLADVILGLLHPKEGEILINGISIHDIPHIWSGLIGYVPQSVYLIDDSIEKNIAFGEEEVNKERLWEAIEKANLKEFIQSLRKGVDTIVGDRGVRLSGGQRQRIAIARALYRKPQILILDEATSALDNDTEEAVMEAINSLQGEITLIIIAHRLTTIENCDIVYVVKNRKVVRRSKEN